MDLSERLFPLEIASVVVLEVVRALMGGPVGGAGFVSSSRPSGPNNTKCSTFGFLLWPRVWSEL